MKVYCVCETIPVSEYHDTFVEVLGIFVSREAAEKEAQKMSPRYEGYGGMVYVEERDVKK